MIKFLRFFVIIFYSFKKCGEFDTVRRIMQDGEVYLSIKPMNFFNVQINTYFSFLFFVKVSSPQLLFI
ncbi:hypothetical protein F1540_06845 [Haemophilus influenzae biotype aegyptius]|nr:hypothetical protein F1540_06845 [Haemophilus influenzae biotype aegyptius]